MKYYNANQKEISKTTFFKKAKEMQGKYEIVIFRGDGYRQLMHEK